MAPFSIRKKASEAAGLPTKVDIDSKANISWVKVGARTGSIWQH